jgi:hypothetical protein
MGSRWLVLVMVTLLVGGCHRHTGPVAPPAPEGKVAEKPSSRLPKESTEKPVNGKEFAEKQKSAAKPVNGKQSPEKPAGRVMLPVDQTQPAASTDQFGLPLVIVIDAPEVPPEIQAPSPPIKEEPASP